MFDGKGNNVEITYTKVNGKWRLWINVDGVCQVRVFEANLWINDARLITDEESDAIS